MAQRHQIEVTVSVKVGPRTRAPTVFFVDAQLARHLGKMPRMRRGKRLVLHKAIGRWHLCKRTPCRAPDLRQMPLEFQHFWVALDGALEQRVRAFVVLLPQRRYRRFVERFVAVRVHLQGARKIARGLLVAPLFERLASPTQKCL